MGNFQKQRSFVAESLSFITPPKTPSKDVYTPLKKNAVIKAKKWDSIVQHFIDYLDFDSCINCRYIWTDKISLQNLAVKSFEKIFGRSPGSCFGDNNYIKDNYVDAVGQKFKRDVSWLSVMLILERASIKLSISAPTVSIAIAVVRTYFSSFDGTQRKHLDSELTSFAAIFISSKFEDANPIHPSTIFAYTKGRVTIKELLKTEKDILVSVGLKLPITYSYQYSTFLQEKFFSNRKWIRKVFYIIINLLFN